MQPTERQAYDRHMDNIRIQNDVLSSAKEEGLAEGKAEGKAEGLAEGEAKGKEQGKAEGLAEGKRLIAINMKGNGISADIISACTGLTSGLQSAPAS